MSSAVTRICTGLADRQHGVVSRRQLIDRGVAESTIGSRAGSGYLHAIFPGVYAVGRRHVSWFGMWLAATMVTGEGAAIGFRSAATMWGFMEHRRTVEVLRIQRSAGHRSQVGIEGDHRRISTHARRTGLLPETQVAFLHGIRVTTVERTLLDLAGSLPRGSFERAFIEADRLGLLRDDRLRSLIPQSHGRRGGATYRSQVERRVPDIGGFRSVFEVLFRDLIRAHRLPEPEINQVVCGFEVDFVWRRSRVVVELDGRAFHRGRELWERDLDRSNRLRADGWRLYRFTWRMVKDSPESVVEMLRGAMVEET